MRTAAACLLIVVAAAGCSRPDAHAADERRTIREYVEQFDAFDNLASEIAFKGQAPFVSPAGRRMSVHRVLYTLKRTDVNPLAGIRSPKRDLLYHLEGGKVAQVGFAGPYIENRWGDAWRDEIESESKRNEWRLRNSTP